MRVTATIYLLSSGGYVGEPNESTNDGLLLLQPGWRRWYHRPEDAREVGENVDILAVPVHQVERVLLKIEAE